jgi:hypothetical protein
VHWQNLMAGQPGKVGTWMHSMNGGPEVEHKDEQVGAASPVP